MRCFQHIVADKVCYFVHAWRWCDEAETNQNSTNLIQRQRQYQLDPRPVYQRLPRSGLYMTAFQIVFWTGTLGIAAGFYNMMTVCKFLKFMLC